MAKIKPKLKPDLSAGDQEKALSELYRADKKKKVQRVTIDFPEFIYQQIKEETGYTGQTIKGFIVGLVRDHFERKEQ